METKTGKIKAIANLGRQKDGSYWEDDNYALRVTEPGSTIKLVTLLSVLEEGSSEITDMVEVGSAGQMIVGPRNVNDAERSPRPVLSVKECFAHSSNVGMSKLAYKAFGNDPKKFKEYLHKYHMDVRSPVDLTDVPKPVFSSFEKNAGGVMNMITMSFGYSLNVSPLHTLTLYNAIANNGKMMKPYLVNGIKGDGIIKQQFSPFVLEENIARPSTIRSAQESMELVVTEGTGRPAFKGFPFAVAGKTGTAHVADRGIQYNDMVYQASFVGYFPAKNPQYSCIVVIRTKPHAALHYGGQLGAPVFKEIASKLYAMYVDNKTVNYTGVKNDSGSYFYSGYSKDIRNVLGTMNIAAKDSAAQSNWGVVYSNNYQPVVKGFDVKNKLMPSVKGMGLKDALFMLENMGLKVVVKGKGKVASQSVQTGVPVVKGMVVYIELS
jgi:cell division protein FtsI (penicillin-binding protein 3)